MPEQDIYTDGPGLRERSTPALIGDLFGHVSELFRKEMMLLRAELNEKATQVAMAAGMLAASLVVTIVALNVLAAAVVAAIQNAGLSPGWSAAIVGVVLALIAFALASIGIRNLKAAQLAPRRTADSLSKDASLAKEKVT